LAAIRGATLAEFPCTPLELTLSRSVIWARIGAESKSPTHEAAASRVDLLMFIDVLLQ
jgi:hypothetical protein